MAKDITERYYDWRLKGIEVSKEEEIVFSIKKDFTDRGGLRQEWEQIDNDIQNEILETWVKDVKRILEK